jgi:hypothetical protein
MLVLSMTLGLAGGLGCGPVDRDGTYSGPDGAFVKVQGDYVVELRLIPKGNAGLMLSAASVGRTGMFKIENGSFTVLTQGPTIMGTFVDGNRKIDGTWSEGAISGTWRASKD